MTIAKNRFLRSVSKVTGLILAALWLTACQAETAEIPPTIDPTRFAQLISAAPLPTADPLPSATAVAAATAIPTPTPAPSPQLPTPTPHPLRPFTINGMRSRDYLGGPIQVGPVLEENAAYTRSLFSYPSDGLTITGSMNRPVGAGPFPVVILLHGYYDRSGYMAGTGTADAADYFARQGYLTFAPDLRSWGQSDSGLSLFHMGLAADVANLISSLPSLPAADSARVGLWGHSMGGGLVTKMLTIDERVGAAVLYAPNSADDADLIGRWGPGCLPGQSEASGDKCNPADIIPPDTPPGLVEAYLTAAAGGPLLAQVSPFNYLDSVDVPLQIHVGTADGAQLVQTPPEWSAKLAEALATQGKAVEYFTYNGQGHFFGSESWALMIGRALELFNSQLRP